MSNWLLNRLFDHQKQPTPRFAFQSTINWMRGLAILVNTNDFSDQSLAAHYTNVHRRNPNITADTYVYERLLMAFHHIAALNQFIKYSNSHYDIVRAAVVSWYYTIYESCSAMVAAASGATSETHQGTAKIWQTEIVDQKLAVGPFALSIKNLTTSNINTVIDKLRNRVVFELVNSPVSVDQAWGAMYSYLKGTADYKQKEIQESLKAEREFKNLGVNNFRSKAAREIRDKKFEKGFVNFAVQAFRYRGKANYRDSIYLSYGDNNSEKITQFVTDLKSVAHNFVKMSVYFVARRTEAGTWDNFKLDITSRSRISIDKELLKC